MPAINLDHSSQTLLRYDVVGERAKGETLFVKHVGLFNEDNRLTQMDDGVDVVHMGPPLEQEGAINVHVAGHVPFTNDEIKEISCWTAEIIDEYRKKGVNTRDQYVIYPVWEDKRDPNTNARRYRRYSCAGFVLDGHHQVNIKLLNIDESVLLPVERKAIISAYPKAEKHPDLLLFWGLEGDGPWKVVLAGYVLHALNRSTEQIRQGPYQAKEGDEYFGPDDFD